MVNNLIVGLANILTYYANKLFLTLFSHINEVTEADIDDELDDAWQEAFDEEPPVV